MAWRRSGDKPLSEPMMVSLPTHICVTRPQWVNSSDKLGLWYGWHTYGVTCNVNADPLLTFNWGLAKRPLKTRTWINSDVPQLYADVFTSPFINPISNHQPHDCLLKRLFRRRSKKTLSSASLASVRVIHWRPVNSPHKRPVKRKVLPFDDIIMLLLATGLFVMTPHSQNHRLKRNRFGSSYSERGIFLQ